MSGISKLYSKNFLNIRNTSQNLNVKCLTSLACSLKLLTQNGYKKSKCHQFKQMKASTPEGKITPDNLFHKLHIAREERFLPASSFCLQLETLVKRLNKYQIQSSCWIMIQKKMIQALHIPILNFINEILNGQHILLSRIKKCLLCRVQ